MSEETKRVGNAGAAAIMGTKPSTWRKSVSERYAPQPDGREEISGAPWWFEQTVIDYRDSRPGRGVRRPTPICGGRRDMGAVEVA